MKTIIISYVIPLVILIAVGLVGVIVVLAISYGITLLLCDIEDKQHFHNTMALTAWVIIVFFIPVIIKGKFSKEHIIGFIILCLLSLVWASIFTMQGG